jgi:hypothetical protein
LETLFFLFCSAKKGTAKKKIQKNLTQKEKKNENFFFKRIGKNSYGFTFFYKILSHGMLGKPYIHCFQSLSWTFERKMPLPFKIYRKKNRIKEFEKIHTGLQNFVKKSEPVCWGSHISIAFSHFLGLFFLEREKGRCI